MTTTNPSSPDSRLTILLVDDETSVLKVVSRRLELQGFRVLTADSGEACLQIAGEELPDLVLLDIMMPRMRGRDVCIRLKSDPATRHIPVIFLTALRLADHVRAGLDAGADDYIIKPFEPDVLRERILVCLARYGKRPAPAGPTAAPDSGEIQ